MRPAFTTPRVRPTTSTPRGVLTLDARNPQTAARLSTAFETWRRYGPDRQAAIRARLDRLSATPGLSRDLGEMIGRMLG